ncbi:sigma-70 family RNA polymerase sigma factor [Enterococcus sp. DIV1368e]|uniref:sigma-70 family RNA polymerase sigma factor n=1 Tax=unclassified Enterococcus TaxID=2608891 RepID=UPI003F296456
MNQNFDIKKCDAQIISYIQKTVHNTAINYFTKNTRLKKAEFVPGQEVLDYLIEENNIITKEMVTIKYENLSLEFTNLDLVVELQNLTDADQYFIVRKYILGFSDYEISLLLSMSRQGVTKKRQRILKKIRKRLIR